MSILAIFLGIVLFVLLFIGMLYLYNTFLKGAVIYDLKQTIANIEVVKPTSSNYYFSCWIYINSFTNEGVNNVPVLGGNPESYDATKAEKGKPIFYYGETMDLTTSNKMLDSTNSDSNKLVYLQLGANSPKLQYYYTTATSADADKKYKFINITENLPIQKWSHVVISTNGKIIECYLDGKLVKTKNETASPIIDTTGPPPIRIGQQQAPKTSDTFISKLKRNYKSVSAKTVYDEYIQGPGTGVNTNTSQYDLKLQVSQNDNVIKTYATR
jgi:hypothetical protein